MSAVLSGLGSWTPLSVNSPSARKSSQNAWPSSHHPPRVHASRNVTSLFVVTSAHEPNRISPDGCFDCVILIPRTAPSSTKSFFCCPNASPLRPGP